MNLGLLLLVAVAALVVFAFMTYNSLVTARMRVRESWSGIDVQLQRRTSLIPNLVETVKGYAAHEKEVFEKVTQARAALVQAGGPAEKAEADNILSGTLKSLFAVAENYPELKANENFLHLQNELTDTEDKIAYSRQFYNTNVLDYNTKIKVVPAVLFANMFGFGEEEFFKTSEEARQDVKVSFTQEKKE